MTVYGGLRGDCDGDGLLDVSNFYQVQEVFDGDGSLWTQSLEGQFDGSPKGCDANRDLMIDAGDLACQQRLLLFMECSTQPRSGPLPRLILGALELEEVEGERAVLQLVLETPNDDANVLVVSLDLAEELFAFDPTDVDSDGVPDALRFLDGLSAELFVAWDPNDIDGEIDLVLSSTEAAGFPDVLRLEIEVAVLGALSNLGAPFRFSSDPPPSLGDTEGRSLPVETLLGAIFANGFETGDLQAWSRVFP